MTTRLGCASLVMGTSKAKLSLVAWINCRDCTAVALGCDHGPRFLQAGDQQQVRGVAHLVGLLVGDDLGLGVLVVPLAGVVPDPDPGSAFYGAVLRSLGACRDFKVAAAGYW